MLSRGILEALIKYQPRLTIQTRGPLVARDIDVLSQFRSVWVNMSIPTDSERVRVRFEPKAPPLEKRWAALRELRAAGRFLETWSHPLRLGRPLPTLPLWLASDFAVPLDLETSYEETCRVLRIA